MTLTLINPTGSVSLCGSVSPYPITLLGWEFKTIPNGNLVNLTSSIYRNSGNPFSGERVVKSYVFLGTFDQLSGGTAIKLYQGNMEITNQNSISTEHLIFRMSVMNYVTSTIYVVFQYPSGFYWPIPVLSFPGWSHSDSPWPLVGSQATLGLEI